MNFPVPVGAFNGNAFQNPLYVLKIGTVDNRRMDFFCNVLLASVYIAVSFIPEMLCDLEIDHIRSSSRNILGILSLNQKKISCQEDGQIEKSKFEKFVKI